MSAENTRNLLLNGYCPWCGEGPFAAVLCHVSHVHGVSADQAREDAGINRHAVLTDSSYHANRVEHGRRRYRTDPDVRREIQQGRNTGPQSKSMRPQAKEEKRAASLANPACVENMRKVSKIGLVFLKDHPELRHTGGKKGGKSGWTEERRAALAARNRTPEAREASRCVAKDLNEKRWGQREVAS